MKVTLLGAGSWGLTLAWLWSQSIDHVCLWDRKPEKIQAIQANRAITFPVELTLPPSVQLTSSLETAVQDADCVVLVVTARGTREVARAIAPFLKPDTIVVNASKGIEFPALKPMTVVLAEELPGQPSAVLSGPTLAKEMLSGLPTACVVASESADVAEFLQVALTRDDCFRLYSNTDAIGVEMGGCLKNIFAIASGYMQAKKLGENARAALFTRGLAEMTRFSVALGAEEQTLFGLSGLGDLLATCNSPFSRNYQVGYRLAHGEELPYILTDMKVVAEGVETTYAVRQMAQELKVDTPITELVHAVLQGQLTEVEVTKQLMNRKLKAE
jgi:glycerol-3-phosphate dehydrogenase (NAD(P)+)